MDRNKVISRFLIQGTTVLCQVQSNVQRRKMMLYLSERWSQIEGQGFFLGSETHQ